MEMTGKNFAAGPFDGTSPVEALALIDYDAETREEARHGRTRAQRETLRAERLERLFFLNGFNGEEWGARAAERETGE